jgi:hypothetical protein
LILLFLKNKIRAVTLVSYPENTGKSGGKFPGIFLEKISRHFPEFLGISEFPEISRNFIDQSYENATLKNIKKTILAL